MAVLQEQSWLASHKHQQLAAAAAAAVVVAVVLVAAALLYQLDHTTVRSMQPMQQHSSLVSLLLTSNSIND